MCIDMITNDPELSQFFAAAFQIAVVFIMFVFVVLTGIMECSEFRVALITCLIEIISNELVINFSVRRIISVHFFM